MMRDVATMKEKVQAWVGNLLGWGRRRQSGSAEKLYAEAIRLSRRPEFFQKYGVADDVDGRFDALSLVVILVMRRLKSLGRAERVLAKTYLIPCLRTWICLFVKWVLGTLASRNVSELWLKHLWDD